MDWLTFLATIITGLAWPAAIVVLAFVFRKALVALIPSLRELEYGKFKLKFERELSEAARRAERAALPVSRQPTREEPPVPEPAASTVEGAPLLSEELKR